jgi:quaternary ammonium compound-resistance protein SugE
VEEFSVAWLILVLAGLLEVVWSLGLKLSHGFTRVVPSAVTIGALVASVVLLERAARVIPVGTAYAVWVGIGVVGVAIGGSLMFDEAMPALRLVFIALIVVSIVGLKLT